jgi:DNA polymerase III subunit delta'
MSEPAPVAPDEPLPWLAPHWARLCAARAADRLPHALLIVGPRGLGKRRLAWQLALALLCTDPAAEGRACGRCADCRLAAAGSHPDLLRVAPDPESKSGEIGIEAIRDLAERTALTPARGVRKLILIDPADRLNTAAANALLKTLEEPAGTALLCLIAEQPGRLPATIRSRCQWLKVPIPPESESLAWLAPRLGLDTAHSLARLRLAYGAPLRALAEVDGAFLEQRRTLFKGLVGIANGERDPVSEAGAWNGVGARLSLDTLAGWLCDLLRLKASAEPPHLDDADARGALVGLAGRIDEVRAHRLLRRVLEARGLADSTLNPLLALESLLIEWSLASQSQGTPPIGRAP